MILVVYQDCIQTFSLIRTVILSQMEIYHIKKSLKEIIPFFKDKTI